MHEAATEGREGDVGGKAHKKGEISRLRWRKKRKRALEITTQSEKI